jgi:hypothetical protein
VPTGSKLSTFCGRAASDGASLAFEPSCRFRQIDLFAIDGNVNQRHDPNENAIRCGAIDDDPDLTANPDGFTWMTGKNEDEESSTAASRSSAAAVVIGERGVRVEDR